MKPLGEEGRENGVSVKKTVFLALEVEITLRSRLGSVF